MVINASLRGDSMARANRRKGCPRKGLKDDKELHSEAPCGRTLPAREQPVQRHRGRKQSDKFRLLKVAQF